MKRNPRIPLPHLVTPSGNDNEVYCYTCKGVYAAINIHRKKVQQTLSTGE